MCESVAKIQDLSRSGRIVADRFRLVILNDFSLEPDLGADKLDQLTGTRLEL
jgi:hypothetical protein